MTTSSESQRTQLLSTTTPPTTDPSATESGNQESDSEEASPVEKIYVEIDTAGNVIGPSANAKRWSKLAGKYVRGKIPIYYKDWRLVDSTFKDAVWDQLMGEFYFNIPEEAARGPMEVKFSETWRTHKSRLRSGFIRRAGNMETALSIVPPKVDPIHWTSFVVDEFKPETIARNEQNAKNRSSNKYSHTMGQCSYARKQNEMDKANPGKRHTRDEIWVAGHVRPDGTVLPSATEAYEKVKAVQGKRQGSGDATYVPIESDVLTEALGMDKKKNTCFEQ